MKLSRPAHRTETGEFEAASGELLPPALRQLGPREVLVNEFFHSLQGESSFAGQRCFFIRLTGCHLRCVYCDTEYAFFEGERHDVEACVERARSSGAGLVQVTGGEPLLQAGCAALLLELCDAGFDVLLETSGAVRLDRVDPRVHKIVDVKTPSSGMARHNLRDLGAQLGKRDEIKVVIASAEDYEWAVSWLDENRALLERGLPVHFSPVHEDLSATTLADWIVRDRLPVRLNLQLHKYLWPHRNRGV